MPFSHWLKVRYSEVDAQGVVFNAHWLTYFDVTVSELLTYLGHDPKVVHGSGRGFDVMLVHAELDWHDSVEMGDLLEIEVTAPRLGGSSFDLRYVARVDGEDKVSATITYVSVVPGERRSCPIPDDVRPQLEALAPA